MVFNDLWGGLGFSEVEALGADKRAVVAFDHGFEAIPIAVAEITGENDDSFWGRGRRRL